jgi:hypothetical protein
LKGDLAGARRFRTLDSGKIIDTANRLQLRIVDRFPGSGLSQVCKELVAIAEQARERCEAIRRPSTALRLVNLVLGMAGLGALVYVVIAKVRFTDDMWRAENFIQEFEALIGSAVFIAAAFIFLMTLDGRLKRARALSALHELRAMAHIIDMHQLTKDPEPILHSGPRTEHSPERPMSPFELSRYFDYCSEMLSILSKIAALYVQDFPDAVAVDAVDDIEDLTNGFSRKIWQKISILDRFAAKATAVPPSYPGAEPPPA